MVNAEHRALESIAGALRDLGNGNAMTSMGAIAAHGQALSDAIIQAGDRIAEAIQALADVMDRWPEEPGEEEK
jgi:hypothetical protein